MLDWSWASSCCYLPFFALLFLVAFGYSSLAKAPLLVNTAVSSIGKLLSMFYLVLAFRVLEPSLDFS